MAFFYARFAKACTAGCRNLQATIAMKSPRFPTIENRVSAMLQVAHSVYKCDTIRKTECKVRLVLALPLPGLRYPSGGLGIAKTQARIFRPRKKTQIIPLLGDFILGAVDQI